MKYPAFLLLVLAMAGYPFITPARAMDMDNLTEEQLQRLESQFHTLNPDQKDYLERVLRQRYHKMTDKQRQRFDQTGLDYEDATTSLRALPREHTIQTRYRRDNEDYKARIEYHMEDEYRALKEEHNSGIRHSLKDESFRDPPHLKYNNQTHDEDYARDNYEWAPIGKYYERQNDGKVEIQGRLTEQHNRKPTFYDSEKRVQGKLWGHFEDDTLYDNFTLGERALRSRYLHAKTPYEESRRERQEDDNTKHTRFLDTRHYPKDQPGDPEKKKIRNMLNSGFHFATAGEMMDFINEHGDEYDEYVRNEMRRTNTRRDHRHRIIDYDENANVKILNDNFGHTLRATHGDIPSARSYGADQINHTLDNHHTLEIEDRRRKQDIHADTRRIKKDITIGHTVESMYDKDTRKKR